MRVALLSPLHSNPGRTQGGIEVVVANLANAFAEEGLDVDLLVYPPKGAPNRPPEVSERVHVVDLGRRGKFTGGLAVTRYLRETQPAALLAAGHRCNVMAALARRLAGVGTRVVLSVHNTMSRRLAAVGPWKRWLRAATLRHVYAWTDGVVAVSHGVADDLADAFGFDRARLRVIHNPLVSEAVAAKAAAPLDHPWFEEGAEPVILAVGRLQPQKDYPTLVRAFARLRGSRPCRLVILGEGPERETIERTARELGVSDDLYMPGIVENPFPYMHKASLYVMSSAWEGLGNVLIEALAVGTPVVSTDCPSGPGEILEGGQHGPLVEVGDDASLADAMTRTLARPPDRDNLRRAAQRFEIRGGALAYLDAMGVKRGREGEWLDASSRATDGEEAGHG